jgi:hypothetical protein
MMVVRQCDFEHTDDDGTVIRQTAWVDAASWGLKAGSIVSFKVLGGDQRRWKVTRVGLESMDVADINSTWHVGGL